MEKNQQSCNFGILLNSQGLQNYIRAVTGQLNYISIRDCHHEHINREWWFFVECNSPSIN